MTFVRYGLVQLVAYGIDMGGFLLLLWTGSCGPLTANIASKAAAGVFAFLAHRRFTFGTGERANTWSQGVRYFALLGLNIPLSSGLLALLLLWIPRPPLAKFVTDVIIVMATYWASKLVVFAPAPQQGAEPRKGQGA
jgi:putative flippase GtrA